MMYSMLKIIELFVLSFFLLNTKVTLCECEKLPVPEKIERADIIFLGEILEVDNKAGINHYPNLVRFKIEKYWKGDISDSDEVKILIGRDRPGMCVAAG